MNREKANTNNSSRRLHLKHLIEGIIPGSFFDGVTNPWVNFHGLLSCPDYLLSLLFLFWRKPLVFGVSCHVCLLAVKSAFKHLCDCQFLIGWPINSFFRLEPNHSGGSIDVRSQCLPSPLNAAPYVGVELIEKLSVGKNKV